LAIKLKRIASNDISAEPYYALLKETATPNMKGSKILRTLPIRFIILESTP